MKKVSTVAARQSEEFSQTEADRSVWTWAIARVGIACWMKRAKILLEQEWARLRKR